MLLDTGASVRFFASFFRLLNRTSRTASFATWDFTIGIRRPRGPLGGKRLMKFPAPPMSCKQRLQMEIVCSAHSVQHDREVAILHAIDYSDSCVMLFLFSHSHAGSRRLYRVSLLRRPMPFRRIESRYIRCPRKKRSKDQYLLKFQYLIGDLPPDVIEVTPRLLTANSAHGIAQEYGSSQGAKLGVLKTEGRGKHLEDREYFTLNSDEEQEPPGVDEMPQSWGEWGRKPLLLPKMSTVALPPPRVRRKSVYAEPSPSMDDDEWKPAVYPKTDDQRRTCRERMRDAMLFKELPSEDLGVLVDAMFYKVPLLRTLNEYEMLNVADAIVTKEFAEGDYIITQGEEADGMYFVEEGRVDVKVKDNSGKEIELQ
ncbi:unnamed protein product, partial [Nesidiocoris tenuis]